MRFEFHIATGHRRNMTENLLKVTLNPLVVFVFTALRHFSSNFARGQLTYRHCPRQFTSKLVHILSLVTENCPS